MASELDKDQFCKNWKRNGGIQKAYNALKDDLAFSSTEVLNLHQDVNKYKEILTKAGDALDEERKESKVLQQTYDSLNKNFLNLVDFLIQQPDPAAIRDKVIELIGTKEYLRTKLEKGLELDEIDKHILMQIL